MEKIYKGIIKDDLQKKIDNAVNRKTDEIISLREKFDKRFGLYKAGMYTVNVVRKTEDITAEQIKTEEVKND